METVIQSDQATTLVDVITQHCRYTGSVENRGYRIADILSDPSSDILEMREARVNTGGAAGTDVRCKQILLKKSRILLVIPKGTYEAPIHRLHRYVEKDRYGAMIVLPGYILSGIVHLPARTLPWVILDKDTTLPSFIGVTDVTVHSAVHGFAPLQCDVAIVRRQSIESVQLAAKPLQKSEGISGERSPAAENFERRASAECG